VAINQKWVGYVFTYNACFIYIYIVDAVLINIKVIIILLNMDRSVDKNETQRALIDIQTNADTRCNADASTF
jgi:hypothetical protein